MNNKGFMLVEVIVVAAFIMITLTSLFVGYSKMLVIYQERSKYYDMDCIYAAKYIKEKLMDDGSINEVVNSNMNMDLIENEKILGIIDNYGLTHAYLLNKDDINKLTFTDNFKKYVDNFLSNQSLEGDYLLVIERKDGDNYYYNYLALE